MTASIAVLTMVRGAPRNGLLNDDMAVPSPGGSAADRDNQPKDRGFFGSWARRRCCDDAPVHPDARIVAKVRSLRGTVRRNRLVWTRSVITSWIVARLTGRVPLAA
jgi:hypothetical protein